MLLSLRQYLQFWVKKKKDQLYLKTPQLDFPWLALQSAAQFSKSANQIHLETLQKLLPQPITATQFFFLKKNLN